MNLKRIYLRKKYFFASQGDRPPFEKNKEKKKKKHNFLSKSDLAWLVFAVQKLQMAIYT